MITINATGDTTLHTAGKYCPEDILVKVPASSSGSGSVDTCTLSIKTKAGFEPFPPTINIVTACIYDGESMSTAHASNIDSTSYTVENVVCGSHVYISLSAISGCSTENATSICMPTTVSRILEITASAGETATITIT